MKRAIMAGILLMMASLACTLGTREASEGEATDAGESAGVPVAKATPTQASLEGETPAQPTQDSAPQPTRTSPPQSPQPQGGTGPIQVLDVNVIGAKLIGVIKNTGTQTVHNVGFDFIFQDQNGQAVLTKYGSAELYTLPPGALSTFSAFFPQEVPAQADRVEVRMNWIAGEPSVVYSRDAFEIVSAEWVEGRFGYEIRGEVRNNSNFSSPQVAMMAIVYNSADRLIGTRFGLVEDLDPGQSAPFTFSFSSDGTDLAEDDPARFEVLAEGRLETE